MKQYEYKNPEDRGWRSVKLTRSQHKEIFNNTNRPYSWRYSYEYFLSESGVEIQQFYSPIVVLLSFVLFPVSVLAHGIANFKEILNDHKKLLNQKKYGRFVSDTFWNRDNDDQLYDKFLAITGHQP